MMTSRAIVSWLTLALTFSFSRAGEQQSAVHISLRERRAEIRAALLACTPPGSSRKEVLAFIQNRLKIGDVKMEPSVAGQTSAGRGVVRAELGDYVTNPALFTLEIPLPLRTRVSARWIFDSTGKLTEIVVDKD